MSTQFRDVNRTLSAGDVVISVADIFDRLQSKVDPTTLDQLLRDIISGRRNQVRPGELITAELINQILAQLESLETRITGAGAGNMPNLFGRNLFQAATIMKQPPLDLEFGNVVDAFGVSIDPDLVANRTRLVINQFPEPGAGVNPRATVDILVAAISGGSSGTGPGTSVKPVIRAVNPFNPARVPVGQDVTIFGDNFALDRTRNKVTFDGIAQDGDPTPESEKIKLVVKVPVLTPPLAVGQEREVTVVVETPEGGRSEPARLVVLPALPGSNPTITTINSSEPNFARVDEIITINGTGFSTTLAENVVTIDTITTSPETAGNSPTALRVKVPSISGVILPTQFKEVNIFVTVNGRKTNVIGPIIVGGRLTA